MSDRIAKHLVGHAVRCTATISVSLFPLLLLAGLDKAFDRSNQLLALRPGLALAAAVVVAAPYLFGISALFGAAWFYSRASGEDEALLLAQAGRGPWLILFAPIVPAAVLALSSATIAWEGGARVATALQSLYWLEGDDLARVATSFSKDGSSPDGMLVGARPGETHGEVKHLRMYHPSSGRVFAARSARLSRDGEGDARLSASDGVARGLLGPGREVEFETIEGPLAMEGFAPAKRWGLWAASTRPFRSLLTERTVLMATPEYRAAARRYRFEWLQRIYMACLPLLVTGTLAAALATRWGCPRPAECVWSAFVVALGMGLGLVCSRQALDLGLGPAALSMVIGCALPVVLVRSIRRRRSS